MMRGTGLHWSRGFLPAVVLGVQIILIQGCERPPRASIIAQVGRHNIEIESFQGYVESVVGEGWKSIDDRVASRLLDQYLDQEVVGAAARRKRRFAIPLEPGRRAAMIRDLVPELCGEPPAPAPEVVERAVQSALAGEQPDRVHVRQIILPGEKDAKEIRARLAAGESFGELSRKLSLAPNAAKDGELGIIARGTLPEELEDVIFRLQPGEVSRPVKGPSGYHLFQVLEVYPGGRRDRRAVEQTVLQELMEDAARRWLSECVRRMAAEVGVRVLTDRLWFRYHGRYSEDSDAATDDIDGNTGNGDGRNGGSRATSGG